MQVEQPFELRLERARREQVGDADRSPRDLVFIGRADAATRGADGTGPARVLARAIEQCVRAQNDGTRRGDAQSLLDGHPLLLEVVHLLAQRIERHDDTVADQTHDVVPQDAGRNQVQDGFLLADHERVSGVVSALKAHDGARAIRQHVDDGAFSSSPHCVPMTTTLRPTLPSHAEKQQQARDHGRQTE